jgi:hypothetical protein
MLKRQMGKRRSAQIANAPDTQKRTVSGKEEEKRVRLHGIRKRTATPKRTLQPLKTMYPWQSLVTQTSR